MLIDQKLIDECIKGKREAQKKLYDVLAAKMFGVSLRYAANKEEAEDILQDGFIKLFQNLQNYKGKGSFDGWAKRIFINTAIDSYYNKSKSLKSVDTLWESSEGIIQDNDVLSDITVEETMRLIQQLPEGKRSVFNLYAIEGYTHKEIAKMLNISENTSKSQLAKARKILTKRMNQINKVQKSKSTVS